MLCMSSIGPHHSRHISIWFKVLWLLVSALIKPINNKHKGKMGLPISAVRKISLLIGLANKLIKGISIQNPVDHTGR